MTDKLPWEVVHHTARITIDNPTANTWDQDSLCALEELVQSLNENDDIYSLVITGQGDKFFSAGADLNLFADGNKGVAAEMASCFGSAFEALSAFRGVSIAAINGYAMGGGLECAMACDLRIAEQHAVMALPEATVGLLPCGGGTQNLAWLVGEAWAKRMILCGERINAETAERIGLIGEIVPRGHVKERAMELAELVCNQSPTSVKACKQLIQAARCGNISEAYSMERNSFVGLFDSLDQKEGVSAFLEKRKPAWKNA